MTGHKVLLSYFLLCTIVLFCNCGKIPQYRVKRTSAHPETCPDQKVKDAVQAMADSTPAPTSLIRHTQEFEKEMIRVVQGAYHFVGYAMANSLIVEAPEGLIVIDTTDGTDSGATVMDDLRAAGVTAKVKAIIYTHDHPDHVGGALGILKDEENWDDIEVWGYETLKEEFWKKFKYNRALLLRRSIRMFGQQLSPPAFINAGLGEVLVSDENAGLLPVPPNKFLLAEEQMKTVTIAGLEVVLMHIPGETRDQMATYIPSLKLLQCGDDFYKTFPNLYSIRGTPPRPVEDWMASIDKMLEFDFEYVVGSHTRPVIGKEEAIKKMTNYRDGIQYTFDQTIRIMNRGLHPDEVAQSIQLPPSLINDVHLLEHYGTVEWSSKTIFEGQLGWFSGYPEELYPLTPKHKADRWVELVGADTLLDASKAALAGGSQDDVKWALILATMVWNTVNVPGATDSPVMGKARELKTEALLKLASYQTSPNGRNYLMTWAFEENCIVDSNDPYFSESSAIDGIPMNYLVRKMATMLDPEKVYDKTTSILLNIKNSDDGDHVYSLYLRNAILEVKIEEDAFTNAEPAMEITIDDKDFRDVLNKRKLLSETSAEVTTSAEEGDEFFSYFDSTDHIYF